MVGESLQEVMMLREPDIQGDFHKSGLGLRLKGKTR